MNALSFIIPGCPPSLNAMLRMHWLERRKVGKKWAKIIWAMRCQQTGPIVPMRKARVEIERRSPKLMDTDNCYGSVKVVVDALKADGIIEDDSPEHITLTVRQAEGPSQTTVFVEREL